LNRFIGTRTGYVTLLATILACGIAAECAAANDEARPARRVAPKSQSTETASVTPISAQQQSGLGAMLYYGGPKSPMWRAPSSN